MWYKCGHVTLRFGGNETFVVRVTFWGIDARALLQQNLHSTIHKVCPNFVNNPPEIRLSTPWTKKVSFPQISGGNVTKFVTHKALKLIARGKLTFEEKSVVHRVVGGVGATRVYSLCSPLCGGPGHTPVHMSTLASCTTGS
jgi:hypothetical protein